MNSRTSIVLQNRNLSRRTARPCWRARLTSARLLALLFGLLIGLAASDMFVLTVQAAPPTISDIDQQLGYRDTTTYPIKFTVGDAETPSGSLLVTGSSSNTTLVPNANLVFGGSGSNRTLTITPAAGQTGTNTITVTVSDADGNSASDTFLLTVRAPGGVGGAGTGTIRPYNSTVDGVGDYYLEYLPAGYNPAQSYPLLVYLHGGGPNMFAVPTGIHQQADVHQYIVISRDGRLLPFVPQTFSQGQPTVNSPFVFDSPVTGPAEQDMRDMLADVQARRSINPLRRYLAGFSMGGWGTWSFALRNPGVFAAIAPGAGPTDGYNMAQADWVTALGGSPLTSTDPLVQARWRMVGARWMIDNAMNMPVHPFHGDADTSVPNLINQTPARYAHSRNLIDSPGWTDARGTATTLQELAQQYPGYYVGEGTWLPGVGHNAALVFGDGTELYAFFNQHTGDPNPLRIAMTTYDDVHETAYWGHIDIAAPWTTAFGRFHATRDPASNSFTVTADGQSTITLDLPVMELQTNQPLTFQAGPLGTYAGNIALVLKGTWTGNEVLKRDGVTLTQGTDYAVGGGLLTINSFSVSSIRSFELTGGSGNTPPTISDIANQTTPVSTPTAALAFTVGDTETAAASLTVSGSSSNTTLVPNANIVFGGSGSNRTVTITPAAGQTGTATITATVTDAGGATASDTFVLTVNSPGNTPPTISNIANQTTDENTTTAAIAFTVGDAETAAGSLIVSGSSLNTTLVPNANIVFGGSGASRTVTITPAAGQTGTATITATVTDAGGATASDTFVLTVAASTAGAAAPEPAGAYLLNQASLGPAGALNAYNAGINAETASGKDLFVGYVLRVEMPDLIVNDNDTNGAIQWDFSPIINSLTAIQQETNGVRAAGYRDLVTLQVLVFPQLLTGGDQPPPILMAQIPNAEQYVYGGSVTTPTLPVPWSQAAVDVLEDFYSQMAITPITDYSQPGNPTVLLKDHPTLANINVAPIGIKGYRDLNSTTKIPAVVSNTGVTYNRDAYVATLFGSIAAVTSAFPNDFAFMEYFGFNDQQDAQYGGETLDQRVDRELDPLHNGPGQSSFGVWRENLGDYAASVSTMLLDYEATGFMNDPEGSIGFQSIRNWLGQQFAFGENAVDSGAVVNGMLNGYVNYGARYLEVYPQDVTITINDVQLAFADIPHTETDAQIQVILQDLLVAWNRYLVNGPGVVADSATVNQNSGANTIQVMANDAPPPGPGPWDNPNTSFPDATNLLRLTVTAVTQGANGAVAIAANGTNVTYTPNAGYSGADSFTYTAGDQYLLKATTTVTVTVTVGNAFSIVASIQGTDLLLTWPTVPGQTFQVEHRPTLDPGTPWSPLVTNWPAANPGTNTTFTHTNVLLQPAGFYRVRLNP